MSNNQTDRESSFLVLGVDTSSAIASFALSRGDEILAVVKGVDSTPHSKAFFGYVSELLSKSGINPQEVQAFAAATGPGSFTGLRVGLAALKGLAHALGKPAIGVNSIDAIALTSKIAGEILVIIDGGRKEIYAGLRKINESNLIIQLGIDQVGPIAAVLKSFESLLNEKTQAIIFGNVSKETLNSCNFKLELRTSVTSTAEEVARQAARLLRTETVFNLRPHYVRPSDAEIKRND